MTACPDRSQLESLLAGDSTPEEIQAMREHLWGCIACCQELDQLTDLPELDSWASRRDGTIQFTSEGVLARLVANLRSIRPGEVGGFNLARFLEPADEPGALGRLGDYVVQAELGQGGMGIVLLALDPVLRRKVAIKVLRPELVVGSMRTRVIREAQAAARFRHPHAVGVYAVSETRTGVPFIVMEYVAGVSLADRLRREGPLAPGLAAAIAEQVAQALAAAHVAGLVHRDVKPANILLESGDRPRLVDFGLALVADAASVASRESAGSFGGTPAYMSPEQVRGDAAIDGRADVYGLGATLYEMLTGEPPFRGRPGMVLDQVLHDEPRPPRRFDSSIPRDLETICQKALAKEPARRYAQALNLASDLECWRAGRPIAARPAGPIERLVRWAKRNPGVASLGSLAILLLVGLALGSTIAALRIDRARKLAVAAERRADLALADAQNAAQVAAEHARLASTQRRLALDTITGLVKDFQQHLRAAPGTLALRKKLAQTAIEQLSQVAQEASGDSEVAITRAIANNLMGELALLAGDTAAADRYHRAAQAETEPLFAAGGTDAVEAGRQLAIALDRQGDIAVYGAQKARAAELHTRAWEVRNALPESYKKSPAGMREQAVSINKLADIHLRAGRLEQARTAFERGLKLTKADDDQDPKRHLTDLRFVRMRLGDVALAQGDLPAAVAEYRRAVAHAQQLTDLDPTDLDGPRQLAAAEHKLAGAFLRQDRGDQAVALYRSGLARFETIVRAEPGNADAKRNVAVGHNLLGDVFLALGNLPESALAYEQSLSLLRELARDDPRSTQKANDILYTLTQLVDVALRAGELDRAMRILTDMENQLQAMVQRAAVNEPDRKTYLSQIDLTRKVCALARGSQPIATPSSPDPYPAPLRALALRALNHARETSFTQALSAATALEPLIRQDPEGLYDLARIHARCALKGSSRNVDEAVGFLTRAVRARPSLLQNALIDPDFIALRKLPSFSQVKAAARQSTPTTSKG